MVTIDNVFICYTSDRLDSLADNFIKVRGFPTRQHIYEHNKSLGLEIDNNEESIN